MATYNQNIAYVEFYGEDTTRTVQKARWKAEFYGRGTPTIYATAEITHQGNNGFTFEDGTTSYDFTITYMQTTTVDKYLKPASRINETTKDTIVMEVRYYKDSARTQLIGTDTFNIQANWYIQNSDFTWTSSTYTNEADIVYEKWDTAISNFTSGGDGTEILGDNGRVTFTFGEYYSSKGSNNSISKNTTDTILRTEGLDLYIQGINYFSVFNPPADKITAFLVTPKTYSVYPSYFNTTTHGYTTIATATTSAPMKAVIPSSELGVPAVRYSSTNYGHTILENLYVFNPLP